MTSAESEPVVDRHDWVHLTRKAVRMAGRLLLRGTFFVLWLWCIGAIWYSGVDGVAIRTGVTALFALAFPVAWYVAKNRTVVATIFFLGAAAIMGIWQLKRPSNERHSSPDMAVLPHGEFDTIWFTYVIFATAPMRAPRSSPWITTTGHSI